jgi:hypothetical protein
MTVRLPGGSVMIRASIGGAPPSRCLGSRRILGTFAFGSHASVGDLTSHLNARGSVTRFLSKRPEAAAYPEGVSC